MINNSSRGVLTYATDIYHLESDTNTKGLKPTRNIHKHYLIHKTKQKEHYHS